MSDIRRCHALFCGTIPYFLHHCRRRQYRPARRLPTIWIRQDSPYFSGNLRSDMVILFNRDSNS